MDDPTGGAADRPRERPGGGFSRPGGRGDTAWMKSRFARLLAAAITLKVAHVALTALVGPRQWLDLVGIVASAALLAAIGWSLLRLLALARRRLLWRVRRKLILSYVFIGFVPVLLIIAFFLFAGVLMFFHVSAYLFKQGIDDVVDQAVVMAETAASELRRTPGASKDVLERKRVNSRQRYPNVSLALVPRSAARRGSGVVATGVGPWEHLPAPDRLPDWVGVGGFAGLVVYPAAGEPGTTGLVIRAVGVADQRDPAWAVVVDLPVDDHVLAGVRETTGIELSKVLVVQPDGGLGTRIQSGAPMLNVGTAGRWSVNSVTFLDCTDWATGDRGSLWLSIHVSVREIYSRITDAQSRRGNLNFGDLFMIALGVLAILFLIIEVVALVMGFALARSITGSIHQLFHGTERVRLGDFTHRIRVASRDQLGDLADSFNDMTSSIQDLLRQREEKRRLEEELRIAREIQMSLLPRGAQRFAGLAISALCVPAREVGGDYYDFFPLGADRLGILIADVAGKGTSAALYMAELKGLMLSLSQIHHSPKALLVEVNRILSDHLDSRSFITMTYAVLDLGARTLTHARAGHTPLIHVRGGDGPRTARLLSPNGLVVGLRVEGVAQKFEQLLVESVTPMSTGDVFVLFTDGITEAMNADADLFGESRLLAIVEEHGDQPPEILRERILREIEAFVGTADQHDDMTMILIKVEAGGRALHGDPPALMAAAAPGPGL